RAAAGLQELQCPEQSARGVGGIGQTFIKPLDPMPKRFARHHESLSQLVRLVTGYMEQLERADQLAIKMHQPIVTANPYRIGTVRSTERVAKVVGRRRRREILVLYHTPV